MPPPWVCGNLLFALVVVTNCRTKHEANTKAPHIKRTVRPLVLARRSTGVERRWGQGWLPLLACPPGSTAASTAPGLSAAVSYCLQALKHVYFLRVCPDLCLPCCLVLTHDSLCHHCCRLGVLLLRSGEQLFDRLCRLQLGFVQQRGHSGSIPEAQVSLFAVPWRLRYAGNHTCKSRAYEAAGEEFRQKHADHGLVQLGVLFLAVLGG
mmetsp:Transcript_587/g.1021  ORF Transcript_587/g.1021 Transcript_587/m.1021 type:complete len:208 (+) Transcript_587:721-1344(+)